MALTQNALLNKLGVSIVNKCQYPVTLNACTPTPPWRLEPLQPWKPYVCSIGRPKTKNGFNFVEGKEDVPTQGIKRISMNFEQDDFHAADRYAIEIIMEPSTRMSTTRLRATEGEWTDLKEATTGVGDEKFSEITNLNMKVSVEWAPNEAAATVPFERKCLITFDSA